MDDYSRAVLFEHGACTELFATLKAAVQDSSRRMKPDSPQKGRKPMKHSHSTLLGEPLFELIFYLLEVLFEAAISL